MALWQADSMHTFYAWFAPDLICSTGPESYNGLPGAILGLAKEDGSVTYFATSVSILNPEKEKLLHPTKKIKYKSTNELKEEIFRTNGRDKMYKELEISYFKYW
jgi:GLPGLI family protein